jgi:hypothetical protein
MGLPMDFGKDEPVGWTTFSGVDRFLPAVHGLQVYPEPMKAPTFMSLKFETPSSGTSMAGEDFSWFSRSLTDIEGRVGDVGQEWKLAADLCLTTWFSNAPGTQVITLVAALEILSQREARSAASLKIIEEALQSARAARKLAIVKDERQEIESLINSLNDLRNTSIGASIRKLVESHISSDRTYYEYPPAEFVKFAYKVRSDLAHKGRTDHDTNLVRLASELCILTRRILIKIAGLRVAD